MVDICLEFQCLPRAGGLNDQDPRFIYFYKVIREARGIRAEFDRKKAGH